MTNIGSEVVKRGAIGTGAAQVFGQPRDNLSAYIKGRSEGPSPEQIAAAKKARDDKFDEWEQYAPEKIWEPYQAYQNEEMDTYRDVIMKADLQNINPNDARFKRMMGKMQDEMKLNAKKIDAAKSIYDDISKYADSEEGKLYYKEGLVKQKLRDYLFNEDGTAVRTPDNTNINKFTKELLNDPEIFNMDGVVGSILETLPEQTFQYYEQINTDNNTIVKESTEIKGKLFQPKTDKDGNIIYKKDQAGNFIPDSEGNPIPEILTDKMGKPIYAVNEETIPIFKRNALMSKYLAANNPDGDLEKDIELTNELIQEKVETSSKQTATSGEKRSKFNWGFGISAGVDFDKAKNWYDILRGNIDQNPDMLGSLQSTLKDAKVQYSPGFVPKTPEEKEFFDRMQEVYPNKKGIYVTHVGKQYENVKTKTQRETVNKGNEQVEVRRDNLREYRVYHKFIPIDDDELSKRSAMRELLNWSEELGIVKDEFSQPDLEAVFKYIDAEKAQGKGQKNPVYTKRNNTSSNNIDGGFGYQID